MSLHQTARARAGRAKLRVSVALAAPEFCVGHQRKDDSMDTVKSAKTGILKGMGMAEGAAILVGLLYVTGYYIGSIFVRNYGIPESELFRLEYIKTGLVFWLLAGGTFLIPIGAFFLTYKVRKTSGLPHFLLGMIGNSLNTIVMLWVPLILSFFATRYEWYLPLTNPVLGIRTLNVAVGWGLTISVFAVVFLPLAERIVRGLTEGKTQKWAFRVVIEPLRFLCLVVSVYLIVSATKQIPWLSSVFGRSGSFVAVSIIFIGGIAAALAWLHHIENVRGSSVVLVLISFGVCFFYYLAITSYVFGVYPAIPANRGGRMPVTEAYLQIPGHESLFANERIVGGVALRGPVYILEQNNEAIYFAYESMDKWFTEFVPVHSLCRDKVPYIRYERINDGFPRVPRRGRPTAQAAQQPAALDRQEKAPAAQ